MKTFHFDGPTWAFLTPEQMYNEEGRLQRAHNYYKDADIYFLSIMNKCIFNPKKTKVDFDGNIKCEICLGNPLEEKFEYINIFFPLSEIQYAKPEIKNLFESRDHFLFTVLLNQYRPKNHLRFKSYNLFLKLFEKNIISSTLCFKILKFFYSMDITVSHKTRYEINIFDPLADCIIDNEKAEIARKENPRLYANSQKNWDKSKIKDIDYDKLPGAGDLENCRLTVNQIINHFNIEVGNQKIAYIGKTEQEPFDRLFTHNKLNKLTAELLKNEYETLIIHLFRFTNWDQPIFSLQPNTATAIAKADAITIAEAELINYFKPTENDKYIKDDGKANWKHIQLLLNKGYKNVRGVLDINHQYAKFYTDHIGDKKLNRHEVNISLEAYSTVKRKSKVNP